MGSIYAVVPAAGRSTRMGNGINKQLLHMAGRPVVEYSLLALLAVPVDGIVLVVASGEEETFSRALGEILRNNNIKIVLGGASRRDSVRQGLSALPDNIELVLVHDGARPLVNPVRIQEAIQAARHWGASTLAVPVKDTIKVGNVEDVVRETLPRDMLWQVQTPQVFDYDLLVEAHQVAVRDGYEGTDDASLLERLGYSVKLVRGDYSNIKITTPEDFVMAEHCHGLCLD